MVHAPKPRLVALLACLVSMQCVAHARTTAASPAAQATDASADPFVTLNQHAREIYGQARSEVLSATGPVLIVYSNDRMVLVHNGRHETFAYAPERAARLKTVAHVSLVAWTLLDHMVENPSKWRPLAASFAREIESVQTGLDTSAFPPDELARQQRIMRESALALRRAAAGEAPGAAAYAQAHAPQVMANVQTAAQLLIDGLNAATHRVQARLGREAFAALHVVILGSHMAHNGEHAAQYFGRLFDNEPEGQRWTFAEHVSGDQKALESLGVHLIDQQASIAFFGNATRMHRDVLSDATQAYLPTLTLPRL